MNGSMNLIVSNDESTANHLPRFRVFYVTDKDFLQSAGHLDDKELLEKLVFNIARKPRHLLTHVQRIYHCFEKSWSEQLFAAVTDLLIVLNGRGRAISKRVVFGTMSRLSEEEFLVFKELLEGKTKASQLLGNQYSIFSKGLNGVNNLIQQSEQNAKPDYDPLELAWDHIEYSQLEQAKHVLEEAIIADPLRAELQLELLSLYRSTRDFKGFSQMLNQLQQSGVNMVNEWAGLNDYFKGQENNG